MFKDASMRIFLGHFVAYIVVTLICAAINLWLAPGTLWWPWVLIGWGVAVAIYAFALLLRKTRRRERIFIDRKARALAVHLFAYIAVMLVLLFVNIAITPKVWWFYWVALGWGAGVLAQGLCVFRRRKPARSEVTQPETERVETKPRPPEEPIKAPGKSPPRKRTPSKRKPKT